MPYLIPHPWPGAFAVPEDAARPSYRLPDEFDAMRRPASSTAATLSRFSRACRILAPIQANAKHDTSITSSSVFSLYRHQCSSGFGGWSVVDMNALSVWELDGKLGLASSPWRQPGLKGPGPSLVCSRRRLSDNGGELFPQPIFFGVA